MQTDCRWDHDIWSIKWLRYKQNRANFPKKGSFYITHSKFSFDWMSIFFTLLKSKFSSLQLLFSLAWNHFKTLHRSPAQCGAYDVSCDIIIDHCHQLMSWQRNLPSALHLPSVPLQVVMSGLAPLTNSCLGARIAHLQSISGRPPWLESSELIWAGSIGVLPDSRCPFLSDVLSPGVSLMTVGMIGYANHEVTVLVLCSLLTVCVFTGCWVAMDVLLHVLQWVSVFSFSLFLAALVGLCIPFLHAMCIPWLLGGSRGIYGAFGRLFGRLVSALIHTTSSQSIPFLSFYCINA